MKNYLFVQVDEWCGLYDATNLIHQGHSLSLPEFSRIVGDGELTLRCPDAELTEFDDYIINHGGCPKTTAEAELLLAQEVGG